ncbi:MAG: hypothetical protein ACRYG4_15735 [Janthinobacterium lividum]
MATTDTSPDPPDPVAVQYRLTLLGSFALRRPDGSLVLGLGRKARALIAVVAMATEPVERVQLADLLWSERGRDQARASLRQTLYELRQQLPGQPPLLVAGYDRVSLTRASVTIDIEIGGAALRESDGWNLLRDLDRLDPKFDQWLIGERTRLAREHGAGVEPPVADGTGDETVVPAPPPPPRRVPQTARRLVAAGALALVVGLAGLIAFRFHSSEPERVVVVQPLATARGDTAARTLADGLAVAVERDVVGTATPVRIADTLAPGAAPPALVLRGNATSRGGRLRANVALVGTDGTVIWSGSFERPPEEASAMVDQLGLQVARELHFAFTNGRNALFDRDPEAIRLSLAAGDAVGRDFSEAARYSAQLLARAPGLARGWSEAAVNAVVAAHDLPERARVDADATATVAARRALAIDPHQGLAYFALAEDSPGLSRWAERERIVSRGLAADPDSPELNSERADDLAAIGRLQEAVGYAQRAFALDHFLPGKVAGLAHLYMDVGNLDAARGLIVRARRMWPGQQWPDALAFELAMYWGDPAEARAALDAGHLPWRHAVHDADLAFLAWRLAPSDATAAAAASSIETAVGKGGAQAELVQQLAALGRIDGAYRLAAALPPAPDGDSRWYRDYLAPFRADLRFMALADRQGMASVWRETGLSADFCSEQMLPYRCAAPPKAL